MTQQAFTSLRISGLTEKMLIEALGRRALAGAPIPVDELIREWADHERATDNTNLEARIQRGIVDKDELLASLRASLSETESSFRRGVNSRSWAQDEDAGADKQPDVSQTVHKAHAVLDRLEEAEFTEPPLPTPAWSDSHLVVVGSPVDATALIWPPGYTLYPGKAPEPADPELPEVGGAGYTIPGMVMPVSEEALAIAAEDREIGLDGPAPARVSHSDPEAEARHTPELDSPDRDPAHPEPAKRARRTKSEMALARNSVTNAYRAAVSNSPWSAGWEAAHVTGLAAADAAGANAGLTPYQTRQTVSPIVDSVREQFDEPQTSALEVDTTEHGPDDAAVQRVEDIVTNEQPPKHDEPHPDDWVAQAVEVAAIVEQEAAYPEDLMSPPAEVAAIHGLAPEPAAPTDDDIFAQFLKG